MSVLVVGGIFREFFASGNGAPHLRLAGSGLYAATAAARLGTSVTLLAPVGSEDSEIAATLASAAGIRARFLISEGASGMFAYETHASVALARGFRPAEGCVDDSILPPSDLGGEFSVVLVFGHPQWDPCASELVRNATRNARLLFDRQGWISRNRSLADGLRLPARQRFSLANFGERIDELGFHAALHLDPPPDAGYDAALVKDGFWGVHLIEADATTQVAAHRVESRSDLGSGDVFAGALAAALGVGSDLLSAARQAAAAAATAITELEPLPGPGFAASVEALINDPVFRPILTPSQRADARLVIEHPQGILGRSFALRTAYMLNGLGFVATKLTPGHTAEPILRLGSESTPLIESGREVGPPDLIDWLAARLSSHE